LLTVIKPESVEEQVVDVLVTTLQLVKELLLPVEVLKYYKTSKVSVNTFKVPEN